MTTITKLQFPIEKDVCYQCVKRGKVSVFGFGKTLRISSTEVHFTTQAALNQGQTVRLAVDWPAMLDDTCPMKLEIRGSVVRSQPGVATVKIARHEFRTRGTALRVMALAG